ncbi:MAG: hypothetical protein LCH47_13210 [Proteobacteria bacterium]|nr:hypothetical protein [Pseudomonadota bacterium]
MIRSALTRDYLAGAIIVSALLAGIVLAFATLLPAGVRAATLVGLG